MTQDYRQIILAALAREDQSVNWLAKTAGVNQPTLHSWLADPERAISSITLARLCGVLGLELRAKRRRRAIVV